MLQKISLEILQFMICPFLDVKDTIKVKSLNKFFNNYINFDHLSLLYLKLNKKFSLKYYYDESFKNFINSKFLVTNPLPISLDLSNTDITDASELGNVHTLNISNTNVSDASELGNIHTLNISNTKVSDVSKLGNVHNLNMSNTEVSDVSKLKKVHTINILNTKVTDISGLINLQEIQIARK